MCIKGHHEVTKTPRNTRFIYTDTDSAEFFVGAEQKLIIHRRDGESAEFFVGAEQKPVIHRRDGESAENFVGREQKRRDAEATDRADFRNNQKG